MAKLTYLMVWCALLLPALSARADTANEARMRYERAVKLYEDAAYDAALAEFTRAYELNPSYKVLYNVGQVRVALQDYAGALETFQQYLREGGGKLPEQRVEQVRKEVAKLEQRVARITVQTDVDGAEVLVDDVIVGTAPLRAPVTVNSGLRRISVRHPDHQTQTQRVSVAGAEQRQVSLPMAPRAAPVAEPPAVVVVPPPVIEAPAPAAVVVQQPKSNRKILLAATWTTTGALALGTTLLGVFALRADGDLADMRGRPSSARELDDQSSKVDRLALATDILLGTTVAAAGVSLWLTLRPQQEQRIAFTGRGLSFRTEF